MFEIILEKVNSKKEEGQILNDNYYNANISGLFDLALNSLLCQMDKDLQSDDK